MVLFANSPFTTTSLLLQSEAVVRWCSPKKVFRQISQSSPENTCSKDSFLMKLQIYRVLLYQKTDSGTDALFVNTGKFLFWEQLFLHKYSFCLLSQHDLVPFKKRCHTYFPAECFLDLI